MTRYCRTNTQDRKRLTLTTNLMKVCEQLKAFAESLQPPSVPGDGPKPRCPKCPSPHLAWDDFGHSVFCQDCGADFPVKTVADFAKFFRSAPPAPEFRPCASDYNIEELEAHSLSDLEYPPRFPLDSPEDKEAGDFYVYHPQFWIFPLAISERSGDHDRALIRVRKAMAAYAAHVLSLSPPAPDAPAPLDLGKDWETTNRERGALIDKKIAGTLTLSESARLDLLQTYTDCHIEQVAPRPVNFLRKLEATLSAPAPDAWVSCAERLPRVGEWCIVVYSDKVQRMAARLAGKEFAAVDGYEWIWADESADPCPLEEISHWQPLPAPPGSKEGE